MSMIPSLSVWSSVKFPFPKYLPESKITKRYSVESCDHFIKRNYEKSKAQRAPEMVNLRVPCGLSVEKENSVPNLHCECTSDKQNSPKTKKKNRHIRFVTVPEIIFYDRECAVSNNSISDFKSAAFETREFDFLSLERDEEKHAGGSEEKGDEICTIPSVKPWTLEELVEINRRIEEAKIKMTPKNNKTRHMKNHARALETSNSIVCSNESLTGLNDSTHRCFFPNSEKRHEYCELYHSKLGLNSGYTEKVIGTISGWGEEGKAADDGRDPAIYNPRIKVAGAGVLYIRVSGGGGLQEDDVSGSQK